MYRTGTDILFERKHRRDFSLNYFNGPPMGPGPHIFPIPCMLNVLVFSLPGLVTICVDAQREFVATGIVVERVGISLRYMNDRYVACSDIVYFALARALYFFFPHLREEAKSKPDWDDLEL